MEVIVNNKRYYKWIMVIVFFATMLVGFGTVSRAEEQATFRDQGGQEVQEAASDAKEAAGAGKDATRETSKDEWQKTRDESREIYHRAKEDSREAWQQIRQTSESAWETIKQESRETWNKVKEKSKEAFTDTKARIHEATAPEPAKPAPEKTEQE